MKQTWEALPWPESQPARVAWALYEDEDTAFLKLPSKPHGPRPLYPIQWEMVRARRGWLCAVGLRVVQPSSLGLCFLSHSFSSYHLSIRCPSPICLGWHAQDSPSLQAKVCSCSKTLLNLSSVRSFQTPWWSKLSPPSCAPTTFGIYHTDKSWRKAWQSTLGFSPGESCGLGVWRAIVHRVTGSLTRMKQLSMRHTCALIRDTLLNPQDRILNQGEEFYEHTFLHF